MKKAFFSFFVILMSQTFAFATYKCVSHEDAHAYWGDEGLWEISFSSKSNRQADILNFSMETKDHPLLGTNTAKLSVDKKFIPKNKKYKNHFRYVAADAWCNYNILLPKKWNSLESFEGLIYSLCEAGDGGTFSIACEYVD